MGNPIENPACVYLGSYGLNLSKKLTCDLNSVLDSTDGGQNSSLESLIKYSC